MHLDRRTVSRKTPRDGRLEISPGAAARLGEIGSVLRAEWSGATGPANLVSMSCTCGGAEAKHDHYFLESAVLRTLPVGQEVDLALESSTVRVVMTPSP
jgi:hypothetical protein